MALDKFIDSSRLDGALSAMADAIRSKTDITESIPWDMDYGFTTQINSITTLSGETADANATAGDILLGKSGYVKGSKVIGIIETKTSSDLTVSGSEVTVPAGYYASSVTTYVASGSVVQNTPTIDTTTGIVTANAVVTTGYVATDTKSNTLQLSTQNSAILTPTESSQTAVSSGKYTLGDVVISAIPSTYVGSGITRNNSSSLTVSSSTFTAPAGYYESDATITMAGSNITEGTTTVNGETATRGTWSQTAGYTSSRELDIAIFKNTETDGHTYVDISNTTSAPVLISGSYLFIDRGYTDDLKISLAKLVPDGTDISGHSEYILSGHSAYDNNGVQVAGSIPTLVSTDIGIVGKTVTIPVGKYTGASNASAISVNVADGAYNASVSSHTVSVVPVVTGSISGTVASIGTTTQPSGTDGTNYWTIIPSGTVTTTGTSAAKGTATITSAGYVVAGSNESSENTISITPLITNGQPRYITKGIITNNTSGGASSGTINRGSQIKISSGYYPNDLYYTAQDTDGTLTITTSHNAATNISCANYTNVNITGINVPAGKSFSVSVPNGQGNIATFTFTVDANGNTTVAES